jgi:hypothetical protein
MLAAFEVIKKLKGAEKVISFMLFFVDGMLEGKFSLATFRK